jgi:dihydroorotate dehydrogenase
VADAVTVYRRLFDSVLSRTDAESAHRAAFATMRAAARVPGVVTAGRRRLGPRDPALAVEALGLSFPSPLGLAAGFDKNAEGIDALAAMGFGFVEVGTVTARPQPGNARPRLFRLTADRAVLNRMGFNNDGAEVVAHRLAQRLARRERRPDLPPVVVGVNIGRSKVVPESEAVADYETSTRLLAPYADYLVVNVSSPNTPGLRDLQEVQRLRPLLRAVRAQAQAAVADRRVPLLVKIAPDLSDDDVLAVADLAVELGLDGVVATNTTVARDGLRTSAAEVAALGAGGVSGEPLRQRSLDVLRLLKARVGDALTLISVGGVATAADVHERLRLGADLVQAYAAFVYEGPAWPARLNRELAARLRVEGR